MLKGYRKKLLSITTFQSLVTFLPSYEKAFNSYNKKVMKRYDETMLGGESEVSTPHSWACKEYDDLEENVLLRKT